MWSTCRKVFVRVDSLNHRLSIKAPNLNPHQRPNQSTILRFHHSATIYRTISEEEVRNYALLSGDTNPIHLRGSDSIVHGTFLLGLVSQVIGTKLPGDGAVVSSLNSRFIKPCKVNSGIKVTVSCDRFRKITQMKFIIQSEETSETLAEGDVNVVINKG